MRLVPRTIASRLVALILATIAVSQLCGLWEAMETEHRAHASVVRAQVFEQVEATLKLLDGLPPAAWADTVEGLSLANLCYTLSPRSLVTAPDSDREGLDRLLDRLRNLVALHAAGEPRLRVLDAPDGRCESYLPVSGRPFFGRPDHHHDFGGLQVSVPLADGRWLNADGLVVLPPVWSVLPLESIGPLVVLTVLVLLVAVRHETKGLRRLAGAVEQLGRGKPVPRIAEAGPAEVVALIRAVNTMQDRITRFVQDRTRLLAAISHDLRTPLTSLRLKAELLEDGEVAEQIIATIEEMGVIVRSTLEFAGADAMAESSRSVDLTSLVDSLVEDMAAIGLEVDFAESPRLDLDCRPIAIRRAVRNLVENAVRYGQRAHVRCRRADGLAVVEVEDEGPGIPEDRLDEVVKPFTRLEESRNTATGGIGLGLAIARDIASAHGGTLVLANGPGGLRASLRLPLPPVAGLS